ncbi:hypothetical protein BO71DRAFT_455824 [Aspergillus ellipticus CBS 707.79]|uniref:Uncharacterized protein n=1 Tax=Aspergillus ellipticus CBS 707.79 TaxID=1448320 RepID=A0A319EQ82_9EURO|nr:hypothetical protein BO71DRAFT_455824 [Aspergillus ellipticus CBS 707.79]
MAARHMLFQRDTAALLSVLLQQSSSIHWGWVLGFGVLVVSFMAFSTLMLWLLLAAYFRRELIVRADQMPAQGKELVGKPLFFPTMLSHTRMLADPYNYTYSYFLVGIPVGLRARIGTLLSIDTEGDQCWFKIDQRHYLNPGDHSMGLKGKLHSYLRLQGEDPDQWPYAYMISIPNFLGSTRNPVTWWLLYSASRELSGLIMEANNSYGERNTTFFRVDAGNSENSIPYHDKITQMIPARTANSMLQQVSLITSTSKAKMYKGKWTKDCFLSPFEKLEGYFTTTCSDPCNPHSETKGPLHSNTTLYAPDGRPKIVSRLYSCGDSLDPLSASPSDLVRFIWRWGHIGALSKPRIIYEALRVRFRGKLTYLQKPEIRDTNVPRAETNSERSLEPFFTAYLDHIMKQYPHALKILYKPSKSHYMVPRVFSSGSEKPDNMKSSDTPTVILNVLGPEFYTNIQEHVDPEAGIENELKLAPVVADQQSRRLWASDKDKVKEIFSCDRLEIGQMPVWTNWRGRALHSIITGLRKSSTPTFMDRFVSTHLAADNHFRYQYLLIKYLVAKRVAFGSDEMLALYCRGLEAGNFFR